MKKILLLSAMVIGFSSLCSAQQLQRKHFEGVKASQLMLKNSKKEYFHAQKANVSAKSVKSRVLKTEEGSRSRRGFNEGVFYNKPEGSFYKAGTSQSGVTYSYIMAAPYSQTIFQNQCTNRSNATWAINGNPVEGDENNDLDWGWVPVNGGVYYNPTITEGSTSYTFCDDYEAVTSYGLVATDDVYDLSLINDAICTTYYAWNTGYGYGPEEDEDELEDGTKVPIYMGRVVQEYPKPMKPLYVDEIIIPYYSESGVPLADGVQMNVMVMEFDDSGSNVVNRYVMPLTADKFNPTVSGQGYIEVSYVAEDELGLETSAGFVINGPFAVLVDGFEQEGVDFGLMLTKITDDYEAYYNGGALSPTVMYFYDAAGESHGGMWYYSAQQKVQYNAPIYILGMFDVINIEEFENVLADAEGGEIYTVIDGEAYYPQVYTTLKWNDEETGEANYTVEDLPSWITFNEAIIPSNADDYYNCYLLRMTVEPLPAGSESRTATIRIVSNKTGIDSGTMTVTQSGTDGITATVKSIEAAAPAYNLAGQRVNSNFKGLVVKDGKKMLNK